MNKNQNIADEIALTWIQLTNYCLTCAVWALQQSLLAATLMSEYQISLSELKAVRGLFTAFDERMNGHINTSDLPFLLKVSTLNPLILDFLLLSSLHSSIYSCSFF